MTIRIANGECVARSLREIFPQDEILPFNEAMCEGEYCLPVYGDAFCSMRAEAYGVSLTDYLKKIAARRAPHDRSLRSRGTVF